MDPWVKILGSKPVGTEGTAKEWGASSSTLCAMVKRGYLTKDNSSPAHYTKQPVAAIYLRAMVYAERNPNEGNYLDLYKDSEPYGMLCRISGHDIVDCNDQIYDLNGVAGVLNWDDAGKAYRVPWSAIFGEVSKRP